MKEVNATMKAMDKCLHNLLKVVFAMITVLSVIGMAQAGAINLTIDSQNANNGYVTINYTSTSRLKVGIRYNGGRETFLDCASGTSNFALEKGNGTYTVALYSNVAGTKYKEVTKSTVNATMKDAFAPFLVPLFFAGLFDRSTEGHQRQFGHFEALQANGNANNGDAENAAHHQVIHCQLPAQQNNPQKINKEAARPAAIDNLFAEGRSRQPCHFEALHSQRDAHNGDAAQRTGNQPAQPRPNANENEPDNVAK